MRMHQGSVLFLFNLAFVVVVVIGLPGEGLLSEVLCADALIMMGEMVY